MVEKKDVELKQNIEDLLKDEKGIPPESLPLIKTALYKMMSEGLTPKEALDIPQEVLEELYERGYHFFQGGKFTDALSVFNILRQFDGRDGRFIFAIAASHHHMKNYVEAAANYILYEALDPTDPLPYYYLYDCFKKMDQSSLALGALKVAYRLSEKDPDYSDLKEKVEGELMHLKSMNQI